MNKTERKAYVWLQTQGYKESDIVYQSHRSPDFLTSDGKGWEVKLARRRIVTFYPTQVQSLKKHSETTILIFDGDISMPDLASFNEITVPGFWKDFRLCLAHLHDGPVFTIRLEDDIHEELRKLADANHRSLNSELIVLIERAVMRAAIAATKDGER